MGPKGQLGKIGCVYCGNHAAGARGDINKKEKKKKDVRLRGLHEQEGEKTGEVQNDGWDSSRVPSLATSRGEADDLVDDARCTAANRDESKGGRCGVGKTLVRASSPSSSEPKSTAQPPPKQESRAGRGHYQGSLGRRTGVGEIIIDGIGKACCAVRHMSDCAEVFVLV